MKYLTTIALMWGIFLLSCAGGGDVTAPDRAASLTLNSDIQRNPITHAVMQTNRFSMYKDPAPAFNASINSTTINPYQHRVEPYTFLRVQGPRDAFGQVYYSDGVEVPDVLAVNSHSPMPSGDYVFFVQGNYPSRMDLRTREIEVLDNTTTYPPCNYVIPAMDGEMWYVGTTDMDLTTQSYVSFGGQKIWQGTGSKLFPSLSADGSTLAYCEDKNYTYFGNRDVYKVDLGTLQETLIYDCGDDREAQYTSLNSDGTRLGFTVAIYGSDGLRHQPPFYHEVGGSVFAVTEPNFWNEWTRLSPDGDWMVWYGNPDPYVYTGYNIRKYDRLTGESFDVTEYNANQDLWCDVDTEGNVIFAHGESLWSHYTPSLVLVGKSDIIELVNLGNINRDFRFIN